MQNTKICIKASLAAYSTSVVSSISAILLQEGSWIHVRFAKVVGYDDIHIPRVTLWYRSTIWQQKGWLFSPILAILLLDGIGCEGYDDIDIPRVNLWYSTTI